MGKAGRAFPFLFSLLLYIAAGEKMIDFGTGFL
jgi:hypothetical protein